MCCSRTQRPSIHQQVSESLKKFNSSTLQRSAFFIGGVFAEEHKCDELLAINPRGQVPTFKDGEAIVNESAGIVTYLENQYPEKPLLPSDPTAKAMV